MVGVVLITHEGVAEAYIRATSKATSCNTERVVAISIKQGENRNLALERAIAAAEAVSSADGILVMTDQKGSTPANIALDLAERVENVSVVSGLNMAMLIRVLDRRERDTTLSLAELTLAAKDAGVSSIQVLVGADSSEASIVHDGASSSKNATSVKKEIKVINRLGLHASAAAKLVHLANKFRAQMFIIKDGKRVDAKSILGVLTLAAAQGEVVEIEAAGEDAQEAVAAIEDLFARRFGEPE